MQGQKRTVYFHIFIWLFAIFANLPYSGIGKGLGREEIASYVIAFSYLMMVFYLFYSLLVPHFLDQRKITRFFISSFLIVLILPFFGYTLLFLAKAYFEGTFEHFYRGYNLKMHMSGYFPVLTAAVFGSFFRVIIRWYSAINQKAETEKQKLVIELELLKNKLNPHFLFNTLNNIDSLIHKDAEAASAALIKLSELMRYMTYETSSEKVELNKEIWYISNFIDLHSLRIKDPNEIEFRTEGDLNILISPALFVPLVENAFKFATFKKHTPSIRIGISSNRGVVLFTASNYFDEIKLVHKPESSGYGIANLRKRLELLYHGRHELRIESTNDMYKVTLSIDTNEDQMHSHR